MGRADANLSACAVAVKRYDRDRWFCALFAPPDRREDLLAIYAFNTELAAVQDKVSEPMLGEIRLQWWREAVDGLYGGTTRRHDVVAALAPAIDRHDLDRALFDGLIDARGADLETIQPETLASLETYARRTASPVVALALGVLGIKASNLRAVADAAGTAQALTGLLRATPHLLAANRILLPSDTMLKHGLSERDLRSGKNSPALAATVEAVADLADEHIGQARSLSRELPGTAVPALLPVTLATIDLARLRRLGHDVFNPRVAERGAGRMLKAALHAMTRRI
ncbi:MAG: phytoene/squalene synthase family protein [Pseudomonadota bacterium]